MKLKFNLLNSPDNNSYYLLNLIKASKIIDQVRSKPLDDINIFAVTAWNMTVIHNCLLELDKDILQKVDNNNKDSREWYQNTRIAITHSGMLDVNNLNFHHFYKQTYKDMFKYYDSDILPIVKASQELLKIKGIKIDEALVEITGQSTISKDLIEKISKVSIISQDESSTCLNAAQQQALIAKEFDLNDYVQYSFYNLYVLLVTEAFKQASLLTPDKSVFEYLSNSPFITGCINYRNAVAHKCEPQILENEVNIFNKHYKNFKPINVITLNEKKNSNNEYKDIKEYKDNEADFKTTKFETLKAKVKAKKNQPIKNKLEGIEDILSEFSFSSEHIKMLQEENAIKLMIEIDKPLITRKNLNLEEILRLMEENYFNPNLPVFVKTKEIPSKEIVVTIKCVIGKAKPNDLDKQQLTVFESIVAMEASESKIKLLKLMFEKGVNILILGVNIILCDAIKYVDLEMLQILIKHIPTKALANTLTEIREVRVISDKTLAIITKKLDFLECNSVEEFNPLFSLINKLQDTKVNMDGIILTHQAKEIYKKLYSKLNVIFNSLFELSVNLNQQDEENGATLKAFMKNFSTYIVASATANIECFRLLLQNNKINKDDFNQYINLLSEELCIEAQKLYDNNFPFIIQDNKEYEGISYLFNYSEIAYLPIITKLLNIYKETKLEVYPGEKFSTKILQAISSKYFEELKTLAENNSLIREEIWKFIEKSQKDDVQDLKNYVINLKEKESKETESIDCKSNEEPEKEEESNEEHEPGTITFYPLTSYDNPWTNLGTNACDAPRDDTPRKFLGDNNDSSSSH